ncbi:MAG: glycosyltransferase [Paludibacteraceae bacterium]|nr:glycosyltransferase [Paludibacteraceae bacterium]
MKILIVASDKNGHFAPFIEEQITALEARGMEVLRYGITGKGIVGYLRELPALRRAIRQHHPDIIHAHYGLSGLLANLQRLVPVVTTYHGSDINVPSILRFSKMAMRLSAYNIFVSKRNVAIALGDRANDECKVESVKCKGTENSGADKQTSTPYTLHPTPKNTLLPCGVNLPKPWSEMQHQQVEQLTLNQWVQEVLNADAKHVLFAGAFDNAVKDPELAKSVIAFYNEAMGNRQWAIDSDTNRQIELIELKGYTRDQVTALMYNCDALLMTSKTEGSPQVIKEAMACGCPIVSVDVGDVAERVSGVEGCYVVPTREPKDIAKALQKAIAFGERTNGREKIVEMGFCNVQVAEQLLCIYKQLLV